MTSWGAHPFLLWHWLREDAPRGKGGPSHVYWTDGLGQSGIAGFWGVACPERKGGAYACLSGRRWGQYLKAGVRLLAIRRCPKRKGRALACLVDRRFRGKIGRGFLGSRLSREKRRGLRLSGRQTVGAKFKSRRQVTRNPKMPQRDKSLYPRDSQQGAQGPV